MHREIAVSDVVVRVLQVLTIIGWLVVWLTSV